MHSAMATTLSTLSALQRTGRKPSAGRCCTQVRMAARRLSFGFTAAMVHTKRWTIGLLLASTRRLRTLGLHVRDLFGAPYTTTLLGQRPRLWLVTMTQRMMCRRAWKYQSGPGMGS